MREPRVSIVMPVYNSRPHFFRESFGALLAQTFGDFDLLLSDNGSGDEAREMYEAAVKTDPRVRYLRHARNYGAELNFNYAFGATSGGYFMWSADDDVRHPEYLARTVKLLDENPRAVSAGSWVTLVDRAGRRVGVERFEVGSWTSPRAWERVAFPKQWTHAEYLDFYALHRRTAVARTHMNRAMDGADILCVRELLLQGPIVHAPEELFSFRVPMGYDMTRLSVAMFGNSRRLLFRHPEEHLALEIMVAALTNDIPISDADRFACVVSLGATMMRRGWFTHEAYTAVWSDARAALRERRFADAALLISHAFVLRPTRAINPGAWRRLVDPKRVRSFLEGARPSGRASDNAARSPS